jgi:Phage capsid family
MNRPMLPLRPDRSALRESAFTSLVRACLLIVRQSADRNARSTDPDVELVLRAASVPHSSSNTATLATIRIALIAALVPTSAAARLIAQSLQLSFDGAYQINIPGLTIPRANWVPEGGAVPVEQGQSTAGAVIDPYKLATIIPFTRELVESSNIEAIMRQMLIESLGPAIDAALFSNAAGVPGLSPPGVLHNITPIAASASTGLAGMTADLGAIAAAIAPASGSGTPMLIAAPSQAVSLTLLAPREVWPVVMSAALPAGTVIAIVPEGLATVFDLPELAMVRDATLHMDTTPNSDLHSSVPIRSLYQTDSLALRLLQNASWALRSPTALAWVQGATW